MFVASSWARGESLTPAPCESIDMRRMAIMLNTALRTVKKERKSVSIKTSSAHLVTVASGSQSLAIATRNAFFSNPKSRPALLFGRARNGAKWNQAAWENVSNELKLTCLSRVEALLNRRKQVLRTASRAIRISDEVWRLVRKPRVF